MGERSVEVSFNRPSSGILSQIFDFHKGGLINRKHNIKHLSAKNRIQAKYISHQLSFAIRSYFQRSSLKFASFVTDKRRTEKCSDR